MHINRFLLRQLTAKASFKPQIRLLSGHCQPLVQNSSRAISKKLNMDNIDEKFKKDFKEEDKEEEEKKEDPDT